MHHNYFVASFIHVGLPIPLISMLMTMFKAQFIFAVGRGGGQRSRCLPPNPVLSKETPSLQQYLRWYAPSLCMH